MPKILHAALEETPRLEHALGKRRAA